MGSVNPADHIGIVGAVAKRYVRHAATLGFELGDLMSIGTIGLMKAVERFDPSRGKFRTYAFYWVEAEIQKQLRTPTRRRKRRPTVSLDAPTADGLTLHDLLADQKPSPFDDTATVQRRERVRSALKGLRERDRRIVRMAFFDEMTLAQIGDVIGVCRERVRQILESALDHLYLRLSCLEQS